MKKTICSVLITAGAVILPFLLCATLVFALPYFTIYSPDVFTEGVCEQIDKDRLESDMKALISTTVQTYSHNAEIITSVIDKYELKEIAGEYFTKYFNSFISGDTTTPRITYRNNAFYYAIKENAHLSQRPDFFEIDENSLLLATKCNNLVENYINSLSIDSAYSLLTSYKSSYLKIAETGKYFPPLATLCAVIFTILFVYIIIQKRCKTLYRLTLSLFSISAIFTVPFIYIGAADLPAKLNISAGASYLYINAVYRFIFIDTSYVYSALSTVLLIGLIASIIWNIKAKTE